MANTQVNLLELIKKDKGMQKLAENTRSVGRAVRNLPADFAGSAVDVANILRGLVAGKGLSGYDEVPKYGSEYLREKIGSNPKPTTDVESLTALLSSFASPGKAIAGAAGILAVPAALNKEQKAIEATLKARLAKSKDIKSPDNVVFDKKKNVAYSIGPDGRMRANIVPIELFEATKNSNYYTAASRQKDALIDHVMVDILGLETPPKSWRFQISGKNKGEYSASPTLANKDFYGVDIQLDESKLEKAREVMRSESSSYNTAKKILDRAGRQHSGAAAHELSHGLNMFTNGPKGGNPEAEAANILSGLAEETIKELAKGQTHLKLAATDPMVANIFLAKSGLGHLGPEMTKEVFEYTTKVVDKGQEIQEAAPKSPGAFRKYLHKIIAADPSVQEKFIPEVRSILGLEKKAFENYKKLSGEVDARISDAMLQRALRTGKLEDVYRQNPYTYLDVPVEEIISKTFNF